MSQVLNMPKFWISQNSEYDSVLTMWALHSVLNMPEYALTEFWIYLEFLICQDSEYGKISKYVRATQGGSKYATIWLNMFVGREYAWMCLTLQ